ncbi:MerR family transcriptional regulator [Pelagicoccus sp. NFK12]|uniref:MerR family transcriptional regulator n=1 Tax=Pelagicoccus enzymogenes TaxID=2773457 RepID=A0A927FA81_9BACT|nr:MerR family transcriptional regulator [Pelagicoccus enzymogenes]MBD5780005.1 MerR family transcriptional regulator [Pelagicoccus enzymogenes]MDQ8198575.1 MerR family transcriptional regulator [Pelagicoccus enzymogenes]
MIQESDASSGYKIGTAAKMAGISPNTIRTWMRRDYFTTSIETDSGERILSSDDLKRLINLKSLIDLGDSIGQIARLDNETLQKRLAELKSTSESSYANEIPSLTDLEAGFVTPANSVRLSAATPLFWNSKSFDSVETLTSYVENEHNLSIALIDSQGPNPAEKAAIIEFAKRFPEITVVLIFDFMPRGLLKDLAKAQVHLLRWPINSIMLERYLYSLMPSISHPRSRSSVINEPPPRLFNERQLSEIANSLPELECECPRHVSSIITSLGAFEDYSEQCLNASEKDKEIHEYLYNETAKARRIMELALIRLCKEDGIEIPQP